MDIIYQGISVVGAFLILLAFYLSQRGTLPSNSAPYLVMNLAGGLLLGVVAIYDRRVGFIILEFTWALISIYGLARLKTRKA